MGFAANDPNLYRYVGNNPTNEVDPSGDQQSNMSLEKEGLHGVWGQSSVNLSTAYSDIFTGDRQYSLNLTPKKDTHYRLQLNFTAVGDRPAILIGVLGKGVENLRFVQFATYRVRVKYPAGWTTLNGDFKDGDHVHKFSANNTPIHIDTSLGQLKTGGYGEMGPVRPTGLYRRGEDKTVKWMLDAPGSPATGLFDLLRLLSALNKRPQEAVVTAQFMTVVIDNGKNIAFIVWTSTAKWDDTHRVPQSVAEARDYLRVDRNIGGTLYSARGYFNELQRSMYKDKVWTQFDANVDRLNLGAR
jgi:hypothetical protein